MNDFTSHLLFHFIVFILVVIMCHRLYVALSLGVENFKCGIAGATPRAHLIDHLIGGAISMLGSGLMAIVSFIEIVGHVSGSPLETAVSYFLSLIILICGGIYQAFHLQREETPGHEFFHWGRMSCDVHKESVK